MKKECWVNLPTEDTLICRSSCQLDPQPKKGRRERADSFRLICRSSRQLDQLPKKGRKERADSFRPVCVLAHTKSGKVIMLIGKVGNPFRFTADERDFVSFRSLV